MSFLDSSESMPSPAQKKKKNYMVKNHSNRKRQNPLPPLYGLLFPISSIGTFICIDRTAHTTAFVTPLSYYPPLEQEKGRKEMFYLTTHSTHFIYGYMASDIW